MSEAKWVGRLYSNYFLRALSFVILLICNRIWKEIPQSKRSEYGWFQIELHTRTENFYHIILVKNLLLPFVDVEELRITN